MTTFLDDVMAFRMTMLESMDNAVRGYGDEDIIMMWLMGGLPDGWDRDELLEIAQDEDLFQDICECYDRCYKYMK